MFTPVADEDLDTLIEDVEDKLARCNRALVFARRALARRFEIEGNVREINVADRVDRAAHDEVANWQREQDPTGDLAYAVLAWENARKRREAFKWVRRRLVDLQERQ